MTRRTRQYVLGYAIGGSLFLIGIPVGLYWAARSFDHRIGMRLISIAGLRSAVATLLLLVGLIFLVWSLVVQNRIGKGGPLELGRMKISPQTRSLVVTGPYRYTRNPMLFGTCAFYGAVVLYLNSAVAAAIVALFTIFMLIFVRWIEERRLFRQFGNDYEEYRRRVSMFVPWLQKRSLKDR